MAKRRYAKLTRGVRKNKSRFVPATRGFKKSSVYRRKTKYSRSRSRSTFSKKFSRKVSKAFRPSYISPKTLKAALVKAKPIY